MDGICAAQAQTTPTPPPPPEAPPAKTLTWPLGGEGDVKAQLGTLGKGDFAKPDRPGNWFMRGLPGVGIGAAVGAAIGGGIGVVAIRNAGVGAIGAVAGAVALGLIGGAIWNGFADQRRGDVPDLARQDTAYSLDFTAKDRPALPPASAVPTVEATTRAGEYKSGISGSAIGSVVTFEREVFEMLNTRVRSTQNTNGEPRFSFGDVSGSEITYATAVNEEQTTHNTLGIGKVLYDTDGYASMSEAMDAFDGKHSVAILQHEDRYYVADFDAEDFRTISDDNAGMVVNDERVKAIFTNKSVYYPTDLNLGPAADDVAAPVGGNVFLFAHGQDIDEALPARVNAMKGQPIGTYDTNLEDTRQRIADRFSLNITDFHMGDEYSGPGWTDRAEAVAHMLDTPGNQALLKSGDRYYVADTKRSSVQGRDISSLNDITDVSTRGAYIHGIRTMDAANGVELLEEVGGLYAAVGDWWVLANLNE